MRITQWKFVLMSGVCALTWPIAAFAQSAPDQAAAVGEVVVTGSRTVTNGNKAPTPVTVVSIDQLQALAPSGLADALNELPQFQGSGSPARNSYNLPASNQTGNNLDLRNLGPQRVLTLFDGMRLVPSANTGLVDSNLIPQLLVQRVDIVTGGASAAYGSDAVSGVVNFVLDKKFTGLSYLVQGGISGLGDDASDRFGFAAGKNFLGGKLHIEGSAEFDNNDGIHAVSDRPLGRNNVAQLSAQPGTSGTAANPYQTFSGVQITGLPYGGYLYLPTGFSGNSAASVSKGTIFGPGGTQIAPITGNIIGTTGDCTGCNFNAHDPDLISAIPEVEKDQFFGRADYKATDAVTLFAQGLYGHSHAYLYTDGTISRPAPTTAFPIYSGNAYLPANLQSALTTAGASNYLLSRMSIDLGVNSLNQDTRSYAVTFGGYGDLFGRFKWDADYSYSRSEQTVDFYNLDNVKTRAALDAVVNPANGQIVCNVTLTNPGLYPGCVPLNLFGQGVASAAAIQYIHGHAIQNSDFTQNVVEANLHGDLFNIWAGPVTGAVGAAYRDQTYTQTSNSNPAVFTAPVGVRGFQGLQFIGGNFGIGGGGVNVKEFYGETAVPLLSALPFAKALDFNGAVRYTDYSTSGGVTTWKVGLSWKPIDDLRLRATKSRDIRAPTLIELYQGVTTANQAGIFDPHTGQNINFVQITSGNSKLKPETADTITIGGVYEPSFISGLSASIDYYSIKVTGAIGTPYTPLQLMTACENSGGTDATCALIQRPLPFSNHTAANNATALTLAPLNVAQIDIAGIDLELNYHRPLLDGQLRLRGLVNIPTEYQQLNAPGQPEINYLGNMDLNQATTQTPTGVPNYNATITVAYSRGPVSISVDEQLISSLKRSIQYVYGDNNNIPAYQYTNIGISYRLEKVASQPVMFLKIDNLFDKQPPFVYSAVPGDAINTNRSLYDIVGRAFTVGVRGKF
jgi:outer membrane receptor protein involved in Fe transport